MNSIVTKKGDLRLAILFGLLSGLLLVFIVSVLKISIPLVFLAPVILPTLFVLFVIVVSVFSEKIPTLFRSAKFAMIGTFNTLFDLGVLNLLLSLFGIASGPYFALFKGVSFLLAATNSYLWNRFWTFNKPWGFEKKEYFTFITMTAVGLIINVGVASFVVDVVTPQFGLSPELWANTAAIIAAIVAMVWNFSSYTFWVFSKKESVSKQRRNKQY